MELKDKDRCMCSAKSKKRSLRTLHKADCPGHEEHNIGMDILSRFPRDQNGAYLIVSPSFLAGAAREAIVDSMSLKVQVPKEVPPVDFTILEERN